MTATARLSCPCRHCKGRAAQVSQAMAAQVGSNKTLLHNVVSMAYSPLASVGAAKITACA